MAFNMDEVMDQAKKMQDKMQQIQDELTQLKVVGEAGNGLVRVIMNGRHEAMKVFVDDSLLGKTGNEHKQYVEELVAAAINGAVDQIEKASQLHLQGLAQSLNLPNQNEAKEG